MCNPRKTQAGFFRTMTRSWRLEAWLAAAFNFDKEPQWNTDTLAGAACG